MYLTTALASGGGHLVFPAVSADPVASVEAQKFVRIMKNSFSDAFNAGHRILEARIGDLDNNNQGKMWSKPLFKQLQIECRRARQGTSRSLAILPKAGQAVLFYSDLENGEPDPVTWHMVCHPTSGPQRLALQKFKYSQPPP